MVRIFDYCQILEANISKAGWDYLIDRFGLNELFEADKRSGWFDCTSIEEFTEAIISEMGKVEQVQN